MMLTFFVYCLAVSISADFSVMHERDGNQFIITESQIPDDGDLPSQMWDYEKRDAKVDT